MSRGGWFEQQGSIRVSDARVLRRLFLLASRVVLKEGAWFCGWKSKQKRAATNSLPVASFPVTGVNRFIGQWENERYHDNEQSHPSRSSIHSRPSCNSMHVKLRLCRPLLRDQMYMVVLETDHSAVMYSRYNSSCTKIWIDNGLSFSVGRVANR